MSYCAIDTPVSRTGVCSENTAEIVVDLKPNNTVHKIIYKDGRYYQATQIVTHTTLNQVLQDPSLSPEEATALINKMPAATNEEKEQTLLALQVNQIKKRH